MKLFSGKQKNRAPSVQLRQSETHPFALLDSYVPLGGGEIRLYRQIREAVPVVDAAILKIVRLTGGFEVKCSDKTAEKELAEFLKTVNVGRGQRGIDSFLSAYLDSMITCGRAVGEIVTSGSREIYLETENAAILLKNNGKIQISGELELSGSLTVNGRAVNGILAKGRTLHSAGR